MNNKLKLFVLMLFVINGISIYASSGSTDSLREARFALPPKDTTGYPLTFIGGLGLTTGSTLNYWEHDFFPGPIFALGIEIPFTNAHRFSIELLDHFWISKTKSDINLTRINSDYINLSQRIYSQSGFSAVLKYYFAKKQSKLRCSVQIGSLLFGFSENYHALEVGYGLNYNVNEFWNVNLTRKILIGHIDPNGNSREYFPNMILLNMHYKLILGRK